MQRGKEFRSKIDGVVEGNVVSGSPKIRGFAKGALVYVYVTGGSPRSIGYVEGGMAYENRVGGPPRPIGKVKYIG